MASGSPVIDIGVNLLNRQFQKDLPRVLKRSAEENVTTIVATGTDLKLSERQIAYIRKRTIPLPHLVCTVGIHPHSAKDAGSDFVARQHALIEANRDVVVAVGECGLDFNRDFSPRDVQMQVFRDQVRLACELHLPLFCHERDAHAEFLAVLVPFLETGQLRASQVVVHCFTGSEAELKTYVRLGFFIGLTGFIAMSSRGATLRRSVASIPLSQLMVETDAPFMHPTQARQRCEPHHIHAVVDTIAECMRVPAADVAAATTANATRFFALASSLVAKVKVAEPASLSVHPPPPGPSTPSGDSSVVVIDGSKFEGGGQILRLAFPLGALLRHDVQVHSIRAGRAKSGLGNQHVCGLTLLASMGSAWTLHGHHLHSTAAHLVHTSSSLSTPLLTLNGRVFTASMATAGAVSLVLQGVLPLLLFAAEPTELQLVGGTHGMYAPTTDWIELALVPFLARMGVHFEVAVARRGFMPRGDGHVSVTTLGATGAPLQPLVLDTPSRTVEHVTCRVTCGAAATVGPAALAAMRKQLRFLFAVGSDVPWTEEVIDEPRLKKSGHLSIHVTLNLGHGNIFAASCAQVKSIDQAVKIVVHELDRVWDSDACVDEHLADNALVYMALAAGTSRLRIPLHAASQHVEAAMYVLSALTGVQFEVETCGKSRVVSCRGLGFTGQ
ncbi:Aste57867_14496 [Aphanomyces stellatus]|uniref:Aste57867_14496 protein n=1 Tax=Aphanomyces stellatus TaxID=120398 RepID=A0A485L3A1_9STRA|nr:hypothetical protein As57867_014442 [Aphanomyces stellatus]VFT91318.1 Aste57867_14496 [Aphanomyces stellatus]